MGAVEWWLQGGVGSGSGGRGGGDGGRASLRWPSLKRGSCGTARDGWRRGWTTSGGGFVVICSRWLDRGSPSFGRDADWVARGLVSGDLDWEDFWEVLDLSAASGGEIVAWGIMAMGDGAG
ncbi:hypothetical protein ACLOJK_032531 [Asimina triloba]